MSSGSQLAPAPERPSAPEGRAGPTEAALTFGPRGELVGILARPRPGEPGPPDLAVVFLNAGILHRIGPNRMHVRLARAVAALGLPALRMDLPGIGDSRTLGTGASALDENLLAIRAAFDLLESRGVARRFVLFGLCSGAADAFRSACADPRVVGICLVDPPTMFPTRKSVLIRVLRWLARPSAWLRLLSGRYGILERIAGRMRRARPRPDAGEASEATAAAAPAESTSAVRELVAPAIAGLVDRGVRICYVVTGDQRHVYNYRTQLLDSFPGTGLEKVARLELFPEAVHTFPHESSRVLLEATLGDWLGTTEFPGPARGGEG